MKRRRVVNSQGLEVTQDEYNGLMRSVANLSRLVVFLEDQLDELRTRLPRSPADSTEPRSFESAPGEPAVVPETGSQVSQ